MKGKDLGACAVLGVLFALLLAWAMPASAWAEDFVAKVDDAEYTTLDDAVSVASPGDTIEILADCSIDGLSLDNKPLTFTGNAAQRPTITFNTEGITAHSSALEFKNCIVAMTVSENPGRSGGTANLFANSNLTLKNSSLSIVNDGADTAGESGLYLYQNSNLYLDNSSMEVKDFKDTKESSGIFCDNSEYSGKPNREIVLKNHSSLTATNCGWHGLTVNPVDISIDGESSLNLDGNGNQEYGGGLGCYYGKLTVTNGSKVVADNNPGTGWGIFIKDFEVDGSSSLRACNNGGDGIDVGGAGIFRSGAKATFCGNAGTGLRVYMSDSWIGDVTVEGKASVTANDNDGYGIRNNNLFTVKSGATVVANDNALSGLGINKKEAKATAEAGANITILRNHGSGIYNMGTLDMQSGAIMLNTATDGGGVNNAGIATLGSDVAVYNNHASHSGDDLFNKDSNSSLAFCEVGSGWSLDGMGINGAKDDCVDAIDAWYDDASGARWEAHADNYDGIHVVKYDIGDAATKTVTGLTALKAAHGLGTVSVDPADITIYMGGTDGYEGVISDLGNGTFDASSSLPEPGFYFVLPDDVNKAFEKAGIAPVGEAADLSQYMHIYTHGYTVDDQPVTLSWKLEKYGKTNSGANGKFIYRIVPDTTEGQDAMPVRLQFTDADGRAYTSDEFSPSAAGALNQHYTMQLYTALVDKNQVVFEVNVNGVKYYNGMNLGTGDLNIRYVTGDQDDVMTGLAASEDEVAEKVAKSPGKAYAVTPEGTTYCINDSQVDVTDSAAPSLLFDNVVSDHTTEGASDYDQQLANRAVDVIASSGTTYTNPWYEAKYLDLVDANNGNVWLKSSNPVTVYWPYPAGTDENTQFQLVHFEGLNREMANGEISGNISSANATTIDVENTPYGIKFTTDGFSPFVLMWEGKGEQPAPEDTTNPSKPATGALAQTGDNTLTIIAGVGAAGVACLGAAFAIKKRSE